MKSITKLLLVVEPGWEKDSPSPRTRTNEAHDTTKAQMSCIFSNGQPAIKKKVVRWRK